MATRRAFVGGLAAAGLAPGFLTRAAEAATGNTIVVAILQAGGNDGLNTVIPMSQYSAYTTLRTPKTAPADPNAALNLTDVAIYAANTGFDADFSIASNGKNAYAFHPAMTSMRALYATGKMAVVTGSGITSDERNRFSHEVGQFDWACGKINSLGYTTAGWIGSAMDGVTAGSLGAAVSLTGRVETVLVGKTSEPLAVGVPLESFSINYGGTSSADTAARKAGFGALQIAPSRGDAATFVRALSGGATNAITSVSAIAALTPPATYDYIKARNFLESQLREIARLIVGNSGVRAFYAVHGGYDTHQNQNQVHPVLVGQLSDSIATFYNYLRAKGASQNVVILTYSDFGRRANANDSLGTDHGSTQINFVVGDPIRGGVYGGYPDLKALDSTGNLQVQLDYRNVIADVIGYLGADAASILGRTSTKVGFL